MDNLGRQPWPRSVEKTVSSNVTSITAHQADGLDIDEGDDNNSLYSELKRRGVFHVATSYLVISWLIAQVADVVGEIFAIPDWSLRALLIALAVGFPVALIVSWTFEFTTEGFKLDSEVGREESHRLRRCRNIALTVIAFFVVITSTLLGMSEPEVCLM